MTETNLNLVLTNALCCSSKLAVQVADLYAMGNKCADAEFRKLKILIDRIESLSCYNFNDATPSEFKFTLTTGANNIFTTAALTPPTNLNAEVTINVGNSQYVVTLVQGQNIKEAIINKLTQLGLLVEYVEEPLNVKIFKLNCDITNFTFLVNYSISGLYE
jgi:hypothetical protein